MLTTVDEQINPITTHWDVALVNQTFWEEDVQIIKTIPVHVEMEHVIGWHYDSKGQFSVKSAYKVHRGTMLRGTAQVMKQISGTSWGRLNVHRSTHSETIFMEADSQYFGYEKGAAEERHADRHYI